MLVNLVNSLETSVLEDSAQHGLKQITEDLRRFEGLMLALI